MNKRKLSGSFDVDTSQSVKHSKNSDNIKKNSLDSDEEDDVDENDYKLNEDDIEGEEEGVAGQYDDVRTTAFNMKEELEEGHFDKDGHYIWKKEKEIKDNWLDNIDWQSIKKMPETKEDRLKGLGESSDEEDTDENFELIKCYKDILTYMNPNESISKTLQRLGKQKKKLSTIERIKMKKAGILDTNEQVVKLTELVNDLMKNTGNMDIYEETYENIKKKVSNSDNKLNTKDSEELDMYSDDFGSKEQKKLHQSQPSTSNEKVKSDQPEVVLWEYKLKQEESEPIQGPFNSEQMQKFIDEKRFDKPIFVRKIGQELFYTSSRIDFELYIS